MRFLVSPICPHLWFLFTWPSNLTHMVVHRDPCVCPRRLILSSALRPYSTLFISLSLTLISSSFSLPPVLARLLFPTRVFPFPYCLILASKLPSSPLTLAPSPTSPSPHTPLPPTSPFSVCSVEIFIKYFRRGHVALGIEA